MIININDRFKVKLTDEGKEIFYHQYDESNEFMKLHGIKHTIKPHFPEVDKDGYTTFQLWHFMRIYGNYIHNTHIIENNDMIFEEE